MWQSVVISDAEGQHPNGESVFVRQLAAIKSAIAYACRRAAFRGADAEDFGSYVMVKLIENDYAVVRKFEGRCTFAAYASVVVQRLLLDYRIHLWGKWHASAEAKRLGEVGMAVESMLVRDGLTLAEAVPALQRRWPELKQEDVESILTRLPSRTVRPRTVALEDAGDVAHATGADEAVFETRRQDVAGKIAAVVREAIASYGEEERLIFRMRFESAMSIADISRLLATPQKPLYRKVQHLLMDLRARLCAAGVDAADAEDVLASRGVELDFGFVAGNSEIGPSTIIESGEREGEES